MNFLNVFDVLISQTNCLEVLVAWLWNRSLSDFKVWNPSFNETKKLAMVKRFELAILGFMSN